ncbi:MAG: tetratricopeptide repeat protein [Gaiellaceae bacterium]
MARSAQRRNRQQRRPTPRAAAPPARRPQPSYEDTMFFPRLRRQTKWMFVFLAIIFGLGYVIFNVGGSIPGTGLGDVLQGIGQSTSGPTEGDARNKIEDHPNDPAGYLELATALQRNGKTDEAIQPLTQYLAFRPKDRAALSQLAGLYLTKGRDAQNEAAQAQNQLTEVTGGGVFSPDTSSPFGQQFGDGAITKIESTDLNQRLSAAYLAYQDAYRNATRVYKNLIAAIPRREQAEQPSVFLQLAFAAQSANELNEAIKAYKRFLLVAPDSPNAAGVREQIKQLEAAVKAQPKQG